MFNSARLKLTGWYLLLIMVLSFGTSFALYHVSSNHLEENASRQIGYFRGLLGAESAAEFAELRQKQLEEDRSQLKSNLILFNVLVLAGGGAISYVLARRTLKPIEDALEAQVRFSADASHELRTPITAIQTENEVALRDPNLTKAEAVKLLKSNLEEAAKLRALSEGLLSLARSDSGEQYDEAVSVKTILEQARDRLSKTAALKRVGLNLPAKQADVTVRGNKQKLTDLVVILLDNAIKYSRSDSKVDVGFRRHGRHVEITVSDKGQGIDKTDLPHIFERFYRADQSRNKQKASGYGLGLAIAKKIIDQHHGMIEVRSAVGKGSVFTVHLPKA